MAGGAAHRPLALRITVKRVLIRQEILGGPMPSDRKIPWRAEAVLLGSGMFGNVAMSALSPALPKIEQAFAGTPNVEYMTKLIVAAVGLGVILITPFTGLMIRRFGRRAVVVGAYSVFLVVGMAGMFLPSLPLVIASRFITGGAGAVVVAMGLILIGDHYEGHARERRIGACHAIGALLVGVVIQAAGFLADVNWRYAFLVHLTAIPMLLLALASPELARPELEAAAQPVADRARRERLPAAVWLIGFVTVAAGAIGYSVQIFVPFHLRDIGANSAALASTMIVITVVTSVATSLLYADVRRFLSPAAVFALGFAGWATGLALTGLTHTVASTIGAMVVIGLAGGLMGPNIFSLLSAVTPDPVRPRAIGLIKGIYYFGPFIGPTVLQLLSLQRRAETALLALAVFGATFAVLCLVGGVFFKAPQPRNAQEDLDAALEAELEADRA
jgi:MFS family permease